MISSTEVRTILAGHEPGSGVGLVKECRMRIVTAVGLPAAIGLVAADEPKTKSDAESFRGSGRSSR